MSSAEDYLRQCCQLAQEAVQSATGGPFGALVVRQGQTIGRGQNRVLQKNDPTAHAEIEAIREAAQRLATYDLADCEIYCSCEPCPMCLGAIYWARLRRVVYAATRKDAAQAGFDDERFYLELERPPEQRTTPMLALPIAGQLAPFEAWLRKTDRRRY